MKNLYNEFFFVPESKKGKIREKVLTTRIAISVLIILACMVSMSLTAYAYFTHSIVASSNIVKAADLKVDVSIKASDGTPVDVIENNDKTLYATLGADEYEVSLSLGAENSAGTGFCMLSFDGGATKYHTQQFIASGDNAVTQVTFKIETDAETPLSITLCWGTSSYYSDYVTNNIKSDLYILEGEIVTLASANPINPITNEQEPETDNNETPPSEISEDDEKTEETPEETSSTESSSTAESSSSTENSSSSQIENSSSIADETSSESIEEDKKEETEQPTEQPSVVESSSEATETITE